MIAVAVLAAGVLIRTSNDEPKRVRNGPFAAERESAATTSPPEVAPAQPVSPPPPAPPSSGLVRSLERLVAQAPAGCLVVASGDNVVYEVNPDAALHPASVVKVLTAIAAVDVLGEAARFRTEVLSSSPVQDGVVVGDLVLVGGGDPTLGTRAWAAQRPRPPSPITLLDDLTDRVVASGVRQVKGRVMGREDRYDRRRYASATPQRLIRDGEIGPVAALTVNDGFRIWGHPGVPFDDPVAGAAEVFTELLRERGVVVEGGSAGEGSAPRHAVSSIESATVGEITAGMIRDSDNETAELLVKAMGHRRGAGTTGAGIAAVVGALRKRGLPVDGLVYADGSGLSSTNRVTCRLLVAALQTEVAALSNGLPVAAATGTLASRFRTSPAAGRLRAKTGSLDGVAALAGFAESPAGTLRFAWVANGIPDARTGRRLQDLVGEALVSGS